MVIGKDGIEDLAPSTIIETFNNVEHWHVCHLKLRNSRGSLFSILDRSIEEMNDHLQDDLVSLIGENMLHIIDVGTGFQNGVFINDMYTSATWSMNRRVWVYVYAESTDYTTADAGTNFDSNLFRRQASSMGILVRIVRKEAHDCVGLGNVVTHIQGRYMQN